MFTLAKTSTCEPAKYGARSRRPECNAAVQALFVGLPAAIAATFFGAISLAPGDWPEHCAALFAWLKFDAAGVNSAAHPFLPRPFFFGGKVGAHRGAVLRLLCARSPLTIARAIIAVVVSTFQREALRARIHIIVKVVERLKPSRANLNASRSVPPIHRMGGIGASAAHLPPYAVKGVTRESAAFFVFHGALYHVS